MANFGLRDVGLWYRIWLSALFVGRENSIQWSRSGNENDKCRIFFSRTKQMLGIDEPAVDDIYTVWNE